MRFFWAGDERTPEPSYYSYTAPEPADLTERPLATGDAAWVRTWPDGLPRAASLRRWSNRREPGSGSVLDFLQSAYEACTGAAAWDRTDLDD